MRVVITGGAGFIGSHLARHWSGRAEVLVLDNLRTGKQDNLAGVEAEFRKGDIRDAKAVEVALTGADIVFHLAAMVSVPESVEQPLECVRDNVMGTLNVLEAARRNGSRVVFASSAAVYGDNPEVPKREEMLPEPKSPYAITKLDGEQYLSFYADHHGLSAAAVRFFNVFGPGQNPYGPYASAVPVFIDRALRGEAITLFGDGTQTRDFIHVSDIVGALSFLAERPETGGVYNAGYGSSTRIDDLATEILRLSGAKVDVVHGPERAGDVKHSYAAADKLRGLGWRPGKFFADALAETVRDWPR